MNDFFRRFSHKVSDITGSPWAFMIAVAIITIWAVSGPVFHFSDTWQLVINTGTTIITFLMVFLIQNTQNRDSKALHLKLDEIIRSLDNARNSLIEIEDLSDEELTRVQMEFKRITERVKSDPVQNDQTVGEIMNQAVQNTVDTSPPAEASTPANGRS